MTFARIAGFRLVTQQPETLVAFYAALGFTVDPPHPIAAEELAMLGIAGAGVRWPMRLGGALVALDRYDMPGSPYPAEADAAAACFQHLALVTDDAQAAWDRARLAGATPIGTGDPVTLPPSSGGVTAMKFRDPEGHPLELLHFPDAAKKGWRGTGLLGIDHSAIVVRDLAASEAFYAAHGLTRGNASLNRGHEQAMLDGLDDPVADVVPMKPNTAPPHVELLHYRRPVEPPAAPVAVNDVAATRIVWHGGDPALLRDPDGHLHQTGG
ncbi:VOC family protein [Sphingomonas dokdonensis]|uniref:Glyoxalase-like domain protein n=1 Tax=Sphingomonas dokdonensis TaxID=344880 RepID=A0A245ZI58_9SPHN|nr:VOC family protein [Sphingomonas dokdonensis]OWK29418.1 glyoxalase-like domain protein [Sphingomonas dokdonensis]